MLDNVKHALKAMWWGSFAGGAPFLIFAIPIAWIGLIDHQSPQALLLVVYPILIAAIVVVPTFLIAGLATTAILFEKGKETRRNYMITGATIGAVLPIALLHGEVATEAWEPVIFFCVSGLFAGAITSFVWGAWRAHLAQSKHEAEQSPAKPNRVHELLY